MKLLSILALAGALVPSAPAPAQTQVSPECAQAFNVMRTQADALLDAAIHGEPDYNRVQSGAFTPAVEAALKACRADAMAKHDVYDLQSRLSTYQSTRDIALRILQQKPPTQNN